MTPSQQKAFETYANILNKDVLRNTISTTSMYLLLFETFKDMVIDRLRDFYSHDFKFNDGKIISPESENYKNKVKMLDKKIFFASLKWFQQNNVISAEDISIVLEIEKRRNAFVHELFNVICDGIKEDDINKMETLITLYRKIDSWWIYNVEVDWDEIKNPELVKQEDCVSGAAVMLQMILDIGLLEQEHKYKDWLDDMKAALEKRI